MPSNHTSNYKLNQWVKTDKVLMDDFNADNAKIDAAIKAVDAKADGLAASKADVSALEALKSTVSKKAEQADMSALQTAMSGKGNCRIWTTSYTGNGIYGVGNPTSVTFPARPSVVFIGERSGNGTTLIVFNGQVNAYSHNYSSVYVTITWSGNTMSWLCGASASDQLNEKGTQYDVVALIAL